MLLLVNILFFVKKNAVKRSAPCEYKKSTVVGSLQKVPIKTRYKNYLYRTQTAGPPNIIRRDAFRRKKCDNAIPMLNDGGDIFLFFSRLFECCVHLWKMAKLGDMSSLYESSK